MRKKASVYILLIFNTFIFGQNQQNKIDQFISANNDKYLTIFKDIHANPEIGFDLTRTANIVAKELKSYGYTVTEGIAESGVAAIFKNGDGPKVMYRADMDALAIKEKVNIPYASKKIIKNEFGVELPTMHACGHDAHTTWLLSTAKFFSENKDLWKGTIILIAQPAEELILGAERMVNDGLYTKHNIPEPDILFGMHSAPISVGVVAAAPGIRTAGTDQIDITFNGVGGHGSMPHLTKDPIIMAADAIMNYQTIISRSINPNNTAVLTVGAVQSGNENNVIPNSAILKVNLRWFSENDRNILFTGINSINKGIAISNNLEDDLYPTITKKGWSFPLDNDKELIDIIRNSLNKFIKEEDLLDEKNFPRLSGSEDFHHLVLNNKKKKYAFLFVGVANPNKLKDSTKKNEFLYAIHNENFIVDLTTIPFGTKVARTSLLGLFKE